MKYTEEFKLKCFNTLRQQPFISKLMRALENGDDTIIRYYLEDSIDDEELYEQYILKDGGDRIIKNSKVNAYNQRMEIYSEFMEQLTLHMDGGLVYA